MNYRNRMTSRLMGAFVTAALAMAAEGVDAGESNAGTDTTEKKKRAPKTNLLDIARGRLPLLFVHAIRFGEEGKSNADVAKAYATSVGKVFDIRKGRNFAYIDKDWKASAEDRTAAAAWAVEAEKHGGDKAHLETVIAASPEATADEAKAIAEKVSAARSKGPRAKGETKAKTGGGEQGEAATAESLLK